MSVITKINKLSDRTVLKMMTTMLVINTGVLIDAMREIHKLQKVNQQWKKSHYYMRKLNEGLNVIAMNPKADPLENRAAIDKLVDDINAEILLDQVDFSGIEEHIKLKDEE